MNILIVSAYYPSCLGGVEYVASYLAKGFSGAGHNVQWCASAVSDSGVTTGVTAVPIPSLDVFRKRTSVPFPIPLPWHLPRLWRAIRQCDVVNVQDSHYLVCVAAVLMAKTRGKRVVVTQHVGNVPYQSWFLRLVLRVITTCVRRPILMMSDQVIFISRAVMTEFQHTRYKRLPLFCPNGVDSEIFTYQDAQARMRHRELLGVKGQVALFVGRFTEKKGLESIRFAARSLPRITFLLVGDGIIRPDSWGLANVRVQPPVSQSELVRYYGAADVLLLPSVGEGFPLVVQEAMACGLPCLISEEVFSGWGQDRQFFFTCEPTGPSVASMLQRIPWQEVALPEYRKNISDYARTMWSWAQTCLTHMEAFANL